jgi:hypothetical protein
MFCSLLFANTGALGGSPSGLKGKEPNRLVTSEMGPLEGVPNRIFLESTVLVFVAFAAIGVTAGDPIPKRCCWL